MGEVLQAPSLAAAFSEMPTSRWLVLHDLDWPTPLLTAADLVVIGPGGIFVVVVVDSRERPATVLLDAPWVGGDFRGDLVERAADAAAVVLELVPGVAPDHVWPVLCFDQDTMLLERCDEVLVCSTANLVSLVTSRFPVLNTRQVHTIHARLRAGIRRAVAAAGRQIPAQSTGPARQRRRSRGMVAATVALGLVVAGGVALAAANLRTIGAAARGMVDVPARLGRPMDVTGHNGTLRVTVRSVHAAGARHGERLLAVEVVLVDLEARPWSGSPARSLWLVDEHGSRFRAGASTRGGSAVLPLRTMVRPGRPLHGHVLVAVPRGSVPAVVEFRAGNGRHGSAQWQLR